MTMGLVERAVAWTVAGLGGWLGYQLLVQHGRLLLRIEALEERLAELTGTTASDDGLSPGLPVGSVFFDFALPALAGGTMTLSQWQGRRVLLIFFDPDCGYCRQMVPDLARLEPDPVDGRPVPLIIATGDADENRRLFDGQSVRCPVLLQEQGEVAQLAQVNGTPTGYLLDEQGRTVGPLAIGAQALLELARSGFSNGAGGGDRPAAPGNSNGYTPSRFGSLGSSRINRNGLTVGTHAPGFRLPKVGGGELSLEDFRGRRVLLVFSDPECGPCGELAPQLEQVYRREPALQVLMVSRGDPDANRESVARYGLTFPVVLQRRWEVSRDYGMFATPIGYLIDEAGVIAADVAVGVDAVLALAAPPAQHAERRMEVAT
jgi:peroxiredoxin